MAWFGKSVRSHFAFLPSRVCALLLNASGSKYAMKGDFNHAIADFDEAIRLDPKNADAFYNRGNA